MTTTPPDSPDDRFRLPPLDGAFEDFGASRAEPDDAMTATDAVEALDVVEPVVDADAVEESDAETHVVEPWLIATPLGAGAHAASEPAPGPEPEPEPGPGPGPEVPSRSVEPASAEPAPWASLIEAASAIESIGSIPASDSGGDYDRGSAPQDDSVIAAAAAVIHAAEADDAELGPIASRLREPAPEPLDFGSDDWLPDFLRPDPAPVPKLGTAVATLEPRSAGVRTEPLEATRMTVARPASRPTVARTVAEIPVLLIVAAVIAFLVKTFLAQAYYIPSGSMLPQLQIDDRVVVSKLAYKAHDPRRGDIVVFDDPRPGLDTTQTVDRTGLQKWIRKVGEGVGVVQPSTDEFIKRVIGLPGDRVEGHDGHVFVNTHLLIEPYLPPGVVTSDFPQQTVEAGKLWVMGDNRSGSADSRVFGQINIDTIVGRAVVKVWPANHISFL